ncbi:MAG: GNAT family N-acetyltransferase [Deltaproteobacteria bacterium]|nr:GNAT family N-acetyltransferase [Deltaproteobacteria bacterium]MBW2393586.1 GNAT family N-acetyltransferase [Deltaproteobacteria bacterium]
MSPAPSIRPALRADAQLLAAIRRDAILTLATPTYGLDRARDWADSSAVERIHRAIEDHEVWLSEFENAVVGWIEIDRDRVEGIYVSPDLAGRGIGSALLMYAEGRIRSAGYCAAALDASWNAEPFYLRRGYEAQAERSAEGGRPMLKPLSGSNAITPRE